MATRTRKLTEPLETVTLLFGAFLVVIVITAIASTLLTRSASFYGFGHSTICATDTHIGISGESTSNDHVFSTKPGAWLNDTANLQACTSHPSTGQRALYTLTALPRGLLFAAILLFLWRIIRTAGRDGPFTPQVAASMRWLGWLVIAGTIAAAAIQELANGLLLNTMLTHHISWLLNAITAPIGALFPAPIIVGCGLLTFSRVMRLAAAMDDEIKATI